MLIGLRTESFSDLYCLPEKDVCATAEVLVYERCWGGVARCPNWSQAGHVLAELRDEVRWFHWVGHRGR
jgi:hypothetical protein